MRHEDIKTVLGSPDFNAPLFRDKSAGEPISIRGVCHAAGALLPLWRDVLSDGTAIERQFEVNFTNVDSRMQLVLPTAAADVIQMVMITASFWCDAETVPVARAYTYSNSDSQLSRGIQYPVE